LKRVELEPHVASELATSPVPRWTTALSAMALPPANTISMFPLKNMVSGSGDRIDEALTFKMGEIGCFSAVWAAPETQRPTTIRTANSIFRICGRS
jgi:hypothetical protein